MTTDIPASDRADGSGRRAPLRRLPRILPRLVVELAIGVGVATVLILVGWASSNAIRFVYGGY